jgi:hypothetical protein
MPSATVDLPERPSAEVMYTLLATVTAYGQGVGNIRDEGPSGTLVVGSSRGAIQANSPRAETQQG